MCTRISAQETWLDTSATGTSPARGGGPMRRLLIHRKPKHSSAARTCRYASQGSATRRARTGAYCARWHTTEKETSTPRASKAFSSGSSVSQTRHRRSFSASGMEQAMGP
jgi:hypothetical protein